MGETPDIPDISDMPGTPDIPGSPGRLDDPAVGRRLARIDELLERVEGVPGPTSEAAIEAVQALAELYGEALSRVVDTAPAQLFESLAKDELIGHLLVLHDLHPDPVERRVISALDRIRPAVEERGGEIELAGIDEPVAHVRLMIKGCGSSAEAVWEAVREAVLAVAPELSEVRRTPEKEGGSTFVPLDALAQRPVATGEPA